MFNLNVIFIIFVILLRKEFIQADFQESKNISTDGGERDLQKVLNEFAEIKNSIIELKSRNEESQRSKELPIFDGRKDTFPQNCYSSIIPNDCAAATQCTKRSGIYKIQTGQFYNETFFAPCDTVTQDGDWLVIQRRHDGSVNFERDWEEYENGFGDLEGEFFIGLKNLHSLTNLNGPQELLIVMQDGNYTDAYAKYSSFVIGSEQEAYKLKRIGKYSGTAGNCLEMNIGMKFTTRDRDNDAQAGFNCAVNFTGAWWYKDCLLCNPNGKYGDNTSGKGINWYYYRGHNLSLPYMKMMIRRSRIV